MTVHGGRLNQEVGVGKHSNACDELKLLSYSRISKRD